MGEQEVKNLLKEKGLSWEEFAEWMIGQTVSSDENGNIIYYTHDVMDFVNMKLKGIQPEFD